MALLPLYLKREVRSARRMEGLFFAQIFKQMNLSNETPSNDTRDSMVIYRSFFESLKGIDKETQADVWNAIFEMGFNENEVELNGIAQTLWLLIKPQILANRKRYKNGKQPKTKQIESKIEAKPKQNESKTQANKNKNKNVNNNEIDLIDVENIDFDSLLNLINDTFKRSFRTINAKNRNAYMARMKQGYKKTDIQTAIKNCLSNNYHIETNYRYCTPEFFSRADVLDKYSNVTEKKTEPVNASNVPCWNR
jgi:uncharacterized phage protein (TIGR02220 family)